MRSGAGVPNQGNWNKVERDKRAGIRPEIRRRNKAVEP